MAVFHWRDAAAGPSADSTLLLIIWDRMRGTRDDFYDRMSDIEQFYRPYSR